MKANGLVKILSVNAVVVLFLILLRDGSTESVSDDMPPPAPLINSVTSSDNNNATVTTLLSRDREREEKVSTLVEEINSLKETIMTGTQTNSTTNNEGVSPEVEAAIESKFKKEKSMKYAQGEVSFEFKNILKTKLKNARTEQDLDQVLNEIHDAALECKNNPDGLRAAVKLLKS